MNLILSLRIIVAPCCNTIQFKRYLSQESHSKSVESSQSLVVLFQNVPAYERSKSIHGSDENFETVDGSWMCSLQSL